MPAWLTIAAGVLKALGLVDQAVSLIKAWQDRQEGRAQQAAADNAAALKEDRDAVKIDDDVHAMPDAALDDELRHPGARP